MFWAHRKISQNQGEQNHCNKLILKFGNFMIIVSNKNNQIFLDV